MLRFTKLLNLVNHLLLSVLLDIDSVMCVGVNWLCVVKRYVACPAHDLIDNKLTY